MGLLAQTPVGGGTSPDTVRIIQKIPTLATFKQKIASVSSALTGSSRTRDWGVFDVELDVKPPSGMDWVDEATVTFYVMMENTRDKTKPPYSFFKLTNKYRDLERGKRGVSAIMLPTAMARFGDVIGLAVEISMTVDGKTVIDEKSEQRGELGSRKKWWADANIIDHANTVKRTGYLVARSQTPYLIVKPDDFEVEVESK